MPEDPNLTPFMNNARAKFGYGTTTLPPETTTIYVPPTTASRRPTTTTTTTEAPVEASFGISGGDSGIIDTGDSGIVGNGESGLVGTGDSGIVGNGDSGVLGPPGDSGAGFGFGPSELPPEFQNIGFGVGGGPQGFNFNVPADKMEPKKETTTTTAAPTTTTPATTTMKPVPKKPKHVQR